MYTESIIVMQSLALRELMSDTEEGGRKERREGVLIYDNSRNLPPALHYYPRQQQAIEKDYGL